MEIKEKCPNCHKPNLIDRPWREDIFCGWCGSKFRFVGELIVIYEVHNNHITERACAENSKQLSREYSGVLSG